MAAKTLCWLASYPKSGNTWLRLFIANYVFDPTEPLPFAKLQRIAMGDAPGDIYAKVAGRPVNHADQAAILALRRPVLEAMAGTDPKGRRFVKTHMTRHPMTGQDLFPADLTWRALYVVRNPLDMVISYADHYGLDHETAATAIASPYNRVNPDPATVTQYLGNWSDHVKSWTMTRAFPVTTLRYEDMLEAPVETFGRVVEALEMKRDEARLEKAIAFSSFSQFRRQEETTGFPERSAFSKRFFRKGEAGQWRTALDPNIADRIRANHRKMMKTHGYL